MTVFLFGCLDNYGYDQYCQHARILLLVIVKLRLQYENLNKCAALTGGCKLV